MNFDRRIVEIAEKQVGVREEPLDSNRGEQVEEYQKADWLDDVGYPWCASFVCWVVKNAREMVEGSDFDWERPRTAGAWDFERWALTQEGKGVELIKPPDGFLPGDIVVFTFSHIGICTGSDGSTISTVEGNTNESGSREGGGVFEKIRHKKKVRSVIRIS
tara:strand:- start:747 stop:1229 length:483 start_codon:yes stop_codon:yes gene_type:complete